MKSEVDAAQPKPSQFLDYKAFLKALYQFRKNTVPHFSYVKFSEELGLGTGNVAWLIINDQRQITRNTSQKIIESLHLKGYEKQYFQTMILYTHAKDSESIDKHLQKLVSLKGRCVGSASDEMVLKFYSQWHHATVFEMVGLENFVSDSKWIRAKLNFVLTEKQVLDSLQMLEELGLIAYNEEQKRHVKVVADFETQSEVLGLGVVQYHKNMIELGKLSIEQLSSKERDIGAVTVAVTPEGIERIKTEVQAFRRYLMLIASQYANPSEIMQVNIQAFSLTHADSTPREASDND